MAQANLLPSASWC